MHSTFNLTQMEQALSQALVSVDRKVEELRWRRDAVARAAITGDIRQGWDDWDRAYWHSRFTDHCTELRDMRALAMDLTVLQAREIEKRW